MKITAEIDRELIRQAGGSRRYALLRIEAPEAETGTERVPLNIAIVIDRSGSMQGEKIEFARQAAVQVVQTLDERDRFSAVGYDHEVEVLVASTRATAEARTAAVRSIEKLESRGSTDLCGGWLRGCKEVADFLDDEQLGRALLLTDGLANQGTTHPSMITAHAGELQRRGISTSTFGVGADFDEMLLKGMAEAGGGNFYFIETPSAIPEFIARELGEGLEVVAREAQILVTVPEGVEVSSLNDFPVYHEGSRWSILLGSVVSRQLLEPVVQFTFPAGESGQAASVQFALDDRDSVLRGRGIDATFHYTGHRDNDRQPRNVKVDRVVARLFAGRAIQQALHLNRDGEFERARKVLEDAAARISRYGSGDAEIGGVIRDLKERAGDVVRPMEAIHRKRMYSRNVWQVRNRGDVGESQRW